tara:strand:+ start:565 stop:666 length:102 start_codon:yes stop_codon:yes gene_type:complete
VGCYKAENLTNDGRTNNVIASADGIGAGLKNTL